MDDKPQIFIAQEPGTSKLPWILCAVAVAGLATFAFLWYGERSSKTQTIQTAATPPKEPAPVQAAPDPLPPAVQPPRPPPVEVEPEPAPPPAARTPQVALAPLAVPAAPATPDPPAEKAPVKTAPPQPDNTVLIAQKQAELAALQASLAEKQASIPGLKAELTDFDLPIVKQGKICDSANANTDRAYAIYQANKTAPTAWQNYQNALAVSKSEQKI